VRYLASEPLIVDLWARECRIGSDTLHLSPTEFDLVVYLMRHPRQAVPIEKIIRHVWRSRSYQRQLNAARIAICRTRARLGEHGCAQLIRSVRGVGYEFIGSVTEVGDSAHERSTPDLGSLRLSGTLLDIAGTLRSMPFFDAAQFCLDKVMETTSGNAGAIYCNVDDQIVLLAERGNPAEFCDFMRGGISFEGRAQVHTLDERQPTQIEDLALLTKSSQTVNIMSRNGFRSYLYIPLVADDQAWGGMRLANRTRRPFDPVVTTFCSAVGAMLSLTLPSPGARESAERRVRST
jgi:DNA-binding winged helix-turn-helix (wHTH) protein